MSTALIVVIVVIAAIALLALAAWAYWQKRRSDQLRQAYGPEYLHTVGRFGKGRGESELRQRRKRVERLRIRPLGIHQAELFGQRWRDAQAMFVDDPAGSVRKADSLVAEVMRTRGYPVGDFEERAADISVDHPQVVDHYRIAHRISLQNDRGAASMEDLRQAVRHYRALFEELLEDGRRPEPERAGRRYR